MSSDREAGPPAPRGEVDRRTFLHAAAATLAATAIVGPRATARAEMRAGSADALRRRVAPIAAIGDEAPWHVDEIWGPTPPCALAVPHAPARTLPVLWEHVDPIDRMLVI